MQRVNQKKAQIVTMTTFIIVRHGETEANIRQIWQGSLDAPLTPRGRRQVEATGRRMAELVRTYPVDHFYVSPLPRAQSTAASIAAAIGQRPVVEPRLREFDLGDWEGRSFRDLKENEDLWNHWEQDPTFAPPNGESPRSFSHRVNAGFRELAAAHPDATVLTVTHGGVISNLLTNWLGGDPRNWREWEAPNCAISVITGDGNGGWQAIMANDVSHLPGEDRFEEDGSIYAVDGG